MSKIDKLEIKPKHLSLADRIQAISGVDDKGQVQDDEVFRKIATEDGRDVDQMISDQDYRSDFMVGSRLAAGRLALEHMKSNKETTTVTGSFAIGRDRLELSFERHRKVPVRIPAEGGGFKVTGEETDVYGASNVKFKARGAKASKGDMGAVGSFLEESFRTAFSS